MLPLNNLMTYSNKSCKKSSTFRGKGRVWGAVLFILSLGLANMRGAQTVQLAWDTPQNSAVAGYALYYGTACRTYTNRIDLGTNTVASVSGLQEGQTYYFAVTAYNSAGVESAFSSEASFITPGLLELVDGGNPNTASMEFPVACNHWYEIQASVDLKTWTTIGQTTMAVSNVWTQFSDPQAGQFPKRFYRLVLH
jgi:Fibronectin type III domain